MLKIIFYFWYVVGLILMLTIGVPDILSFSNGLFLVFFALYALTIEQKLGEKKAIIWTRAALIGVLTFTIEWIGVRTGFPFGEYNYSNTLGFLLDGVPITIATAWVGVLVSAVVISEYQSRWVRAIFVGLWALFLDLVLDPVAFAKEFWMWEHEGGFYYGIPLDNFIIWFILPALLSFVFPLRSISYSIRKEMMRLYQMMLLFFGILGIGQGMVIPLVIAIVGVILAEGVLRRDQSRQKQMV
ncbi:carotenoid biosynthesis protein [Bacillus horti]|uniref:Membrane protein n=1 Tax=Caldalkalibacillus horti TaxID=77523 RepID=A0ABT9W227_9BACI|nr:carotenoid biosynthesis protein [Bacillus horti]MDQ0167304.1 putative membrane protein [Bacillus horti]